MKIVTIGGYGFTEEEFFRALKSEEVTLFVDVRQRRGLRGARYSFLNSQRLQAKLSELGIEYTHRRDLAPSTEIRSLQKIADSAQGEMKSSRSTLSQSFVTTYRSQILKPIRPQDLLESFGNATCIAFFCVEKTPQACHRGLIASYLSDQPKVTVRHICKREMY